MFSHHTNNDLYEQRLQYKKKENKFCVLFSSEYARNILSSLHSNRLSVQYFERVCH